jgi:hypothetical protein
MIKFGQAMHLASQLALIQSKEKAFISKENRELLAVRQSLDYYSQSWKSRAQPVNIYWLTDSENLVRFLTKESGKIYIQREIFSVMTICQQLKIRIIPIHLMRDDPRIQIADQGSKISDTDDWSIDDETFQRLNHHYQFTINFICIKQKHKVYKLLFKFFLPKYLWNRCILSQLGPRSGIGLPASERSYEDREKNQTFKNVWTIADT